LLPGSAEAGMADHQDDGAGIAFETTDPELAVHLLCGGSGHGMRITPRGRPGRIRADQVTLSPAVCLQQLSCACALDLQAEPFGVLLLAHVRAGRLGYRSVGSERRYGAGDVCFAAQHDQPNTARYADLNMAVTVIAPELLGQAAGTAPGRSPQPVRLIGYQPVSAGAARYWKATWSHVRYQVLGVPEAARQPLLIAAAERLIVASVLAAFPNNALTDPTIEDRHDAHPATLRRAAAFIEENAHRAITIADIAAAANVTVRAVQLAFRRHLDTTPLAYLRRVRLEHAHRDLLAADPAHETVTAVAYRWGFPSTSRLAAQYRLAYGVPPSRTLHG
jgi:AraC-like DNA-binding protein